MYWDLQLLIIVSTSNDEAMMLRPEVKPQKCKDTQHKVGKGVLLLTLGSEWNKHRVPITVTEVRNGII